MDSDQGKLFIGGISWETTEENLRGYFGVYGEVVQTVIMRDKLTGKPRGFGFVVFADPSILDRVLQETHTIDGRTVEAKRALSREQQTTRSENSNAGRGSSVNTRTKKIFVGGLPATLSEEEFRQYFQTYGNVVDVVVMYDQNTQRPRGFGFISFDDEDAVERVLHKTFHDLQGKQVEVKRALPKDGNSSTSGARFGPSGGSYQSFGSGNGTGSYDNTARYGQQQTAGGGGYPSYGSAGYGSQPGYGAGYAAGNAGAGYAAGNAGGGYAAGNAGAGYGGYGYGGPGSGYGNPNAQQPQKSSWNSQAPGGYGPGSGYGGPAQPQNPGMGGYGNQGYGYGGAPNNGVADQGVGYGDASANIGYGSGSWNPQGGYGGGYGGQARQ